MLAGRRRGLLQGLPVLEWGRAQAEGRAPRGCCCWYGAGTRQSCSLPPRRGWHRVRRHRAEGTCRPRGRAVSQDARPLCPSVSPDPSSLAMPALCCLRTPGGTAQPRGLLQTGPARACSIRVRPAGTCCSPGSRIICSASVPQWQDVTHRPVPEPSRTIRGWEERPRWWGELGWLCCRRGPGRRPDVGTCELLGEVLSPLPCLSLPFKWLLTPAGELEVLVSLMAIFISSGKLFVREGARVKQTVRYSKVLARSSLRGQPGPPGRAASGCSVLGRAFGVPASATRPLRVWGSLCSGWCWC